jgi:putative ABC transport system ATP-binding protein
MLLDISGLRAGYGGRVVLSLDALQIAPGEHTLLLGPSGSGKTTLLHHVRHRYADGTVTIKGNDPPAGLPARRDQFRGRHIGLVMQRMHLISALSVEGNLALAQKLAGLPVDGGRILATLDSLGIGNKLAARPRQLSQGEAQRVAIARAVINQPPLILADEPTSALDDDNCAAALDLLFAQSDAHGATLVVATHDQRVRQRFSRVLQLAGPRP